MIDYSERELVLQEQLAQAEQDCDSAYAEIARLEAELADAKAENKGLQGLIDNCRDAEDRKAAIFRDHVKDGVISDEGFEKLGRSQTELRQVYRDLIAAANVTHDLQQPLEQEVVPTRASTGTAEAAGGEHA